MHACMHPQQDTGKPATTTGVPPGTEAREPKFTGGHQERALAA
jgi:hypothetical protein